MGEEKEGVVGKDKVREKEKVENVVKVMVKGMVKGKGKERVPKTKEINFISKKLILEVVLCV